MSCRSDFRLPAETNSYHFVARRSLPGPQECLNQQTFSAHNHLRKRLNHSPSGTSGSASSQRASKPSWAVENSLSRTRLTRCAISLSGMRSRRIQGIAYFPWKPAKIFASRRSASLGSFAAIIRSAKATSSSGDSLLPFLCERSNALSTSAFSSDGSRSISRTISAAVTISTLSLAQK